jgi:hypothetical protein
LIHERESDEAVSETKGSSLEKRGHQTYVQESLRPCSMRYRILVSSALGSILSIAVLLAVAVTAEARHDICLKVVQIQSCH